MTGPLTGTSAVSGSDSRQAGFEMVDAGFFQSVVFCLVEGRLFTRADRLEERQIDDFDADRGSGVAIVSENFARQHLARCLPNRQVAVRQLRRCTVPWRLSGWRTMSLPRQAGRRYRRYICRMRKIRPTASHCSCVRRNAAAPVEPITTYLRQGLGADAMAFNAQTYDAITTGALARPRFSSRVMAVFAVTAMALTALAMYSVLSFVVALRRRELAIRLALGADQRALVLSVFREGLFSACAGVTTGLAGRVVLTKMLRSALSDLGSAGALEIGIAGGFVLVVASAASYWPAKQAGLSIRSSYSDPTSDERIRPTHQWCRKGVDSGGLSHGAIWRIWPETHRQTTVRSLESRIQCTNVRTSEKTMSPVPVIDQTRQFHSPPVVHSCPVEIWDPDPGRAGRLTNSLASS